MNKVKKSQAQLNEVFKKYAAEYAYLYGSQVTGNTNKESDFDFAVMLSNELSDEQRFKVRLKLMSEISRILKTDAIDLIILNDVHSIFLKFVVIKEGLLIFDQCPSERIDFELKTMNEYYDFKPFIVAYNKAYIQRQIAN
jgi:predicted nucleotidyltransferase